MKDIVGFGTLNLDLIFGVEDFKSISSKEFRLDPGKQGFGSDEAPPLEALRRAGARVWDIK